ncbi:MAG: hypothetical protein KOO69_02750 [Victivallales bacterium]|nr:hypothetical protein [Victivallales bacterium]
MKRHKQFKFLFLILTALVFSSQDLEHLVFHSCEDSHSHSYCSDKHNTKHTPEINDFTGSINNIFSKHVCLICSSISGKSIATVNTETEFTTLSSLDYSQLRESFSFNSYTKALSRGPPAV